MNDEHKYKRLAAAFRAHGKAFGKGDLLLLCLLQRDHIKELETHVAEHVAINYLRADEGASVTINCDNPDGPPNNAIDIVDEWTNWIPRRIEGESVLDCLDKAVEAKKQNRE